MPISNPCRPRVDWITRSQPQFQYNLVVRGAHMTITEPYRRFQDASTCRSHNAAMAEQHAGRCNSDDQRAALRNETTQSAFS